MRSTAVVLVLVAAACHRDPPKAESPPSPPPPPSPTATPDKPAAPDPLRDEYIQDVMAFTNQTYEQVRDRMKLGSVPLKQEWEAWEAKGPMTDARIKDFYKQTTNYIYELAEWHLNVPEKRVSDEQIVKDLKAKGVKNVLDFGGGVGMIAFPIARGGIDITLSDLDSTSLNFAMFRAKRHDVKMKFWKSDVEPMPPDAKYDVILALDVLEHLPRAELDTAVEKLIKLKHAKTQIIMAAPFGRTAVHPMHLDADEHTKKQVERLKTEFTP